MKASQYKAIREAGVAEFAIYPADVEAHLPWSIQHANRAQSVRACPVGLVRATVVKDDVEWSEMFTLGCGDTEYQRKRRNGVRVEIPLAEFRAATKMTAKRINEEPRTRTRQSDGSRVVEMIVSKAAIMAPWNEYALIEAEREKAQAEKRERKERLDAVVAAVGAREGRFSEVYRPWDNEKEKYVPPPRGEYDYAASFERRGTVDPVYLRGDVVLSLERAEEIAALLANRKTGGK